MAFEGTLQEFTIRMHGHTLEHQYIEAQQGDTASRKVRIHLKTFGGADFLIPYGATAVLSVDKTDGHKVLNECEIEDSSTIIITLTSQTLACPGKQPSQIYIFTDKGDIKTQKFYINVPKAVYDQDAIESSDEYGILLELIERIENLGGGGSGATEEQLEQIEQNKNDITQLKSDLGELDEKIKNLPTGDVSWNDLTDKPFYEYSVDKTLFPPQDIRLTNDISYSHCNPDEYIPLVVGKTYAVSFDDEVYNLTAKTVTSPYGLSVVYVGNNKFLVSMQNNFGDVEGIENTGEPFCLVCAQGVSAILSSRIDSDTGQGKDVTFGVILKEERIKQLDPKYIKDMYYTEEGAGEVLPETTALDASAEELMPNALYFDPNEGMLFYTDIIQITVGATYTVKWNGIGYKCVANEFTVDEESAIILGDTGVFTGTPTGEYPFALVFMTEPVPELPYGVVGVVFDGSTSVRLGIYGGDEKVHPIHPKYIPEMYYAEPHNDVVLTETTFEVDSMDGNVIVTSKSLKENGTYIVTWNGNEYKCGITKSYINYYGKHVCETKVDGIFMLSAIENSITIDTLDGSSAVTISIREIYEEVHKIPSKYMPDSYSTIFSRLDNAFKMTELVLPNNIEDLEDLEWVGLAYGNGLFAAASNVTYGGCIVTSTDGYIWTKTEAPDDIEYDCIFYEGGKFIALSKRYSKTVFSSDGITWTSVDDSDKIVNYIDTICYGNGVYVAVGIIKRNTIYYSNDAITWNSVTLPESEQVDGSSVCYGGDKFVTAGYHNGKVYYSTDGSEWTEATFTTDANSNSIEHSHILYANDMFVLSAGYNSGVYTSADGITWSKHPIPTSYMRPLAAYGNGVFVEINRKETKSFVYSYDFETWNNASLPERKYIMSLCFFDDKFMVLCGDGTIMYSKNGKTWTNKIAVQDNKNTTKELADVLLPHVSKELIGGATKEQIAQIEQNKTDISELRSDFMELSAKKGILNTASGESIVLTDSVESKLEGLRVFGKSEQNTTSGAQLLDFSKFQLNTNVTFEVLDGGETLVCTGGSNKTHTNSLCVIDVTNLKGKTVHVRVDSATSELPDMGNLVQFRSTKPDGSVSYIGFVAGDNRYKSLAVEEDCEKLELCIYSNNTSNILTSDNRVTIKGLRVTLNNGDGWEPYTGGIPSPNPQYPQEIVSVGDDEDVEVGVYGGNLLDITKINSLNSQGITFTNVDNEYIKVVGTATGYASTSYFIDLPNGTYVLSGCNYSKNMLLRARLMKAGTRYDYGCGDPFEVTDEVISIQIMIQADAGWVVDTVIRPILNKGTIPLPYEPYHKQTLLISTPNGLRGIKVTDASIATYTDADGQMWVADEVDFERGVYVQRIGTEVFDGSDDEYWYHDNGLNRSITEVLKNKNKLPTKDDYTNQIACTSLMPIRLSDLANGQDGIAISTNGFVSVRYSEFDSKEKWMEYMNSSPMVVQYILAEPIETPLTAEEIEAYKALHTNYPTTTIISEAHMDMKYGADTKNYIDNKFTELTNAILSMGGNV